MAIYFGSNPLNNTLTAKMKMVSILPEGWAFFTKNANEPRQYTYKVSEDGLHELNQRNFSSEYYFGMSRYNRLLSLQLNSVFKKVNNDSSIRYVLNAGSATLLTEDLNVDTFRYNQVSLPKTVVPDINGKYLMIMQLMLPWGLLHRSPGYSTKFIVYPIIVNHE
jgi:hypothetical protein